MEKPEVKRDSCFYFEIPASVSNFSNLISENFIHNIALIQLPVYWQIIAQVIDCIMTKRQQTQMSNLVTAFADCGCVWHPLSVSKDQ